MFVPTIPLLYNAELNTLANLPSWYAGGITAGLAVFIFAIVNPLVVPNVFAVINACDPLVTVAV